MIFQIPGHSHIAPTFVVSLRCPRCRQQGTFEPLASINDVHMGQDQRLGQRRCPNDTCRAHVFFVSLAKQVLVSYPHERIDFDATGIPPNIVRALEEAITCHASRSFTASAIMVRKTLEELCKHEGATGNNLKGRIQALGAKVTLPAELLTGLDELRLLGNDAAHVEATAYNNVGQEEVEVGILFAKEVLKAVYQYKSLLTRLKSLKKAP